MRVGCLDLLRGTAEVRAHPKAIMERLGHSSIHTLDRYGHLLPGLDEKLTDGLEAAYRASLVAAQPRSSPVTILR